MEGEHLPHILLKQSRRQEGRTEAEMRGFQKQSELKSVSHEAYIQDLIGQYNRECAVFAALPPVRKLPAELMIKIFELVLEGEREHSPRGGRIPGHPGEYLRRTLCISHVCARWRQIAMSTRELWTPAVIEADLAVQDDAYAVIVGSRLFRSASLPISVSLRGQSDRSPESRGGTEQVLDMAPGWRCLRLLQPNSTLLAQLGSCTLGCLEELVLGSRRNRREDGDESPIHRLDVPLLRKLTFDPSSSSICQLPWDQLTDLTLIPVDSLCTGFGVDAITLTNLLCLTITFACRYGPNSPCPGNQCMEFFGRLWVSSLKDLHIIFDHPHGWNETVFTAFLLRTQSITSLEFSKLSLTPKQFMDILDHTPALTRLALEFYEWLWDTFYNEAHILALTYRHSSSSPPRLPCLQYLTIRAIPSGYPEQVVAGVIRSRSWPGCPLLGINLGSTPLEELHRDLWEALYDFLYP
ncbi:hypothetical protein C8R46DRAFT_1281243 [Mycena filopes]|nr:hypothetical protein C8R46DRAFT_1281243 [Mycena filopes]